MYAPTGTPTQDMCVLIITLRNPLQVWKTIGYINKSCIDNKTSAVSVLSILQRTNL